MKSELNSFKHIILDKIECIDVRYPTSTFSEGTDSMHSNCDYSCAYVQLSYRNTNDKNDSSCTGIGIVFTLGKGTEVVVTAIESLKHIILNQSLQDIIDNFAQIWRKLTSDPQMRWLGPEKGVYHLATAGIVNSIWDLWAKLEKKPLWKLLTDIEPLKLINMLDFRYVEDVLTKDDALQILTENLKGKDKREEELISVGFPAYTTAIGI